MLRTVLVGILIGCGTQPADPDAIAQLRKAFPDLHRQVYTLYEAPMARHGLHDQLAGVYTGEALTEAYIDHWTTRSRMAEEETSVKILEVTYADVQLQPGPNNTVDLNVDWSVGGIVTHRSHSHPRVNRYRAVFTLAQTEGGPRIIDTRLQSAERIQDLLSRSSKGWILDQLPENAAGFLSPLDLLEAGMLQEEGAP